MRTEARVAIGLLAAGLAAIPATARADDEPIVVPVVKAMMGPAFHIGQEPLVQFALDATAGALVFAGKNSMFLFDGELGYHYDASGLNAFNLQFAMGVGQEFMAYVAYQPRLILGTIGGEFAGGMRNGIGGHFLFDAFNVELGHQFVSSNGTLGHSVNLMFGSNPAAVIYVVTRFIMGVSR